MEEDVKRDIATSPHPMALWLKWRSTYPDLTLHDVVMWWLEVRHRRRRTWAP